ncbi:MAG: glutamate-1-semialdehyde 2,1-aminomutase [Lachnospiraceae bacterium]|nr:glutamate-1-semialdehyde 2,1-aminomutase [Lachnospiraceae bacterium]
MSRSEELFKRACEVIPGGVNSPVRAFGSVGENPRFIASADGGYMTDADGKRYLDLVGSWGPMILGHNHPAIREAVLRACEKGLSYGAATEAEVEIAELICSSVRNIGMVRMVNSGTEAVMSAIRTARGFTGRDKIVKFMGCYHGHSDALLVQAGSGVMTAGVPDSAGVPAGCTKDTLSAVYNDLSSVETLFEQFPQEIAAVIVEPVAANMGVVPPAKGFLEGLRSLCTKYGALLIFDEVITGFRLGYEGAQGYFGVDADLVTYGKIIGAGMPVGAYGGRKEIMSMVAPAGPVYQAGTLSGNPVAMQAGLTQLRILKEQPEIYTELNAKADRFYTRLDEAAAKAPQGYHVNHIASLGCLYFTKNPVVDYASAKTSDTKAFAAWFRYIFEKGYYIAPSQFEAMFLSAAHTEEELGKMAEAAESYFGALA